MFNKLFITSCLAVLFFLSSCASHKDLILFRKGNEKTFNFPSEQTIANQVELKLQYNDIIAVAITSLNNDLVSTYSFGGAMMQQMASPTGPTSFVVSQSGEIDFPNIGILNVQGLTLRQLRDTIKSRVEVFVKKPTVNVRLLNFKITVLGEVGHPGSIAIEGEQINLLEAIGRAGDFTPFSDRSNVVVVRELKGKRQFITINTKSMELFSSSAYYLQQNDIIYVEPKKTKMAQVEQPINRYLAPIQGTVSLLAILIAFFR